MRIITIEEARAEQQRAGAAIDRASVEKILSDVKEEKDDALRRYTRQFDGVSIDLFKIGREEIECASTEVEAGLVAHIRASIERLRRFSERQLACYRNFDMEIEDGVIAGQRVQPIERVGVYVPGGHYPLISSVYMGVVPAKVAGVKEIAVCSPPSYHGSLHPALVVSAIMAGADELYRVGGVQAIGAMAYGTPSIKRVDKIVGPGNAYVTAAKKLVYGSVGIDFIAGPTEILIIADDSAKPAYLAADLLGQAEHDADAGPVLVTNSALLAERVSLEVQKQLASLPTREIARQSLANNGMIVVVDALDEAIEYANLRAPEHVQLHLSDAEAYLPALVNYGSLFIGSACAEVLGDYSSGLNHVLPTNLAARYSGGLSVRDFIKIQTTLRVNRSGLQIIGPAAYAIARAEGLEGHTRAVKIRLDDQKDPES